MIRARCKFRVNKVTPRRTFTKEDLARSVADRKATGPVIEEHIKLWTEYDENDPEDTKFSVATPSGSMEFSLSNPNLLGHFKVGDTFYVTLEQVAD